MKTIPSNSLSSGLKTRSLITHSFLTALVAMQITAQAATSVEERVESLLGQMTLAEKIGQMTQVDTAALPDKSHIQKYFLGSVLSGGGSDPDSNSPQGWLKLSTECQSWAGKTRLKIPLLYGIDAVHGHNNVDGAVIFPHNIGLGATRNPALIEAAARITAKEIAGTGINWAFAPCVAVAQDARWGRTYESFSDSPLLAGELGAAAVRGFQNNSVLACAKHFVGDGGTQDGVDQGNTVMDEVTLRKIHLAPYLPAIKGGVGSVMISFSSWNGVKMHGHKRLITDVLKGELGFKGFTISDWAGIDQLPHDYKGNIEAAVNAGMDMFMVPNGAGQGNNYMEFIAKLTELVNEKRVPMTRVDDAVRRILRVKVESGVFEQQAVDASLTAAIGSAAHRQVARDCVRESLVVLKNDSSLLPLSKNIKHLHVVGKAADDLGIQCGGWTISWQGETGKVTRGGTTILEAIRQTVSASTAVSTSPDGTVPKDADAVVVVIGELPYAEGKGDIKELNLSSADQSLVKNAKLSGKPVLTVLLSGRPLILGSALESSDAFVAAWLPGTEGRGVTDILFGDFKPTGKLPRPWPLESGVVSKQTTGTSPAKFPFGFGLTYATPPHGGSPIKTASSGGADK